MFFFRGLAAVFYGGVALSYELLLPFVRVCGLLCALLRVPRGVAFFGRVADRMVMRHDVVMRTYLRLLGMVENA